MKTRREIIDEIIKSGNKVGTIDDIVPEYYVEFDKILSNGVIELIGEDKIKIHSVCDSFEGDMENVDRIEYDKYRKTKKWKNLSKLVKEKAGNKCTFCKSTKRLVAHHHNYINLYNETEKDLICVCGQCHRKIHMGCSCFRDNDLCEVCKFSKENYTVMYNYLISDIRNFLGIWCERKQHIK